MPWNIKILAEPQEIDADAYGFLTLFSSELARAAASFHDASLTENLEEAVRLCHRMRGAAALYGFKELAEKLLTSETLIHSGELLPSAITADLTAVVQQISIFADASKQRPFES